MYIGPETMLPLSSAIAAVAGLVVMFWHKTTAAVRGFGRKVSRLFGR